MTEPTTGEQNSTGKAEPELSEAVRIVRKTISAKEEHLQQIAVGEEHDPILLMGETSEGYDVHIMVDPAKVAQVKLDYEYPLYDVLEEEPPQEMWSELARMVGLKTVYSVDM